MRPNSFPPLTVESFEGRVLPSVVAPPRPHLPEPAAHVAEVHARRLDEISRERFQHQETENAGPSVNRGSGSHSIPVPHPRLLHQAMEQEHGTRPERVEVQKPVPTPPTVGTLTETFANRERLLAALPPALSATPTIVAQPDRAVSGLPIPDALSPGFLRFAQNLPDPFIPGENTQSGAAEVLNRIELTPGTVPQSVAVRSGPLIAPGPILRAIEQFRNGVGPLALMRVAWDSEQPTPPPPGGADQPATHTEPVPSTSEASGSLFRTVPGVLPLVFVFATTNLVSADVGDFAPSTETSESPRTGPAPDTSVTRVANLTPSQYHSSETEALDSESLMLPFHGVPILGDWAADLVGIQAECENLLTTLVDLAKPTSDDGTSTESWLWATGLALLATGMAYGSGLRPVRRAIPGTVPGWDSTSIRLNGTDHA